MLQLNNQGKSFSEIGQLSGSLEYRLELDRPCIADLDNRRIQRPIFITNGYKRDYTNMDFMNFAVQKKLVENETGKRTAVIELLENIPSTIVENYAYRNNGDLTFTKVNSEWGLDQKSLSNGAAYADLDNDGDLDLVVNNIEETAFVYRNNSESLNTNNFLKIRLEGNDKNTYGIGSKVTVFSNGRKLVQELYPTRGYQSSVDFTLVFGIEDVDLVDSLKVIWPDSREQSLRGVKTGQTLVLKQNESTDIKNLQKTVSHHQNYFTDVSQDSLIPFTHKENNYNDFKLEQLLPHKLSTQGPKMAKGDVNGDGLIDIYIGGGEGKSG